MSAFMYSVQRLPACMIDVRHIVLGQSVRAFAHAGYSDMNDWEAQSAPGRRRKWLFDGARDPLRLHRFDLGSR